MARMASDVLEIQTSFLSVLELLIREPLTIIFTLLVMFNISWPLTPFCRYFYSYLGDYNLNLMGNSCVKI